MMGLFGGIAQAGVRRTATLLAALTVAAGTLVAFGDGAPALQVAMSSGSAWLPSSREGLVTLVDGTSEEVIASVVVAPKGVPLSAVQQGSDVYVSDPSRGAVVRVDGATSVASEAIQYTGGRTTSLEVFASKNSLVVVDGQRGIVTRADQRTLKPLHAPLGLGAQPRRDQSVLDDSGTLWVVDAAKGGLVRVGADGAVAERADGSAVPPTAQLLAVRGEPVLFDGSRLYGVESSGDLDPKNCRLDVRPGESTQITGSPTGNGVYVALSERGVLLLGDLEGKNCPRVVPVGSPGDKLGEPLEEGGRVFVPNSTRGSVVVVDLATTAVVADLPVSSSGSQLELQRAGHLVVYNDLASEVAGILRLENGAWQAKPVRKYDPKRPRDGVVTPPGDRNPRGAGENNSEDRKDDEPGGSDPFVPPVTPPPGDATLPDLPEDGPHDGIENAGTDTGNAGDGAAGGDGGTDKDEDGGTDTTVQPTIAGPASVQAGTEATFTPGFTPAAEGVTMTKADWNFGDGTTLSAAAEPVRHTWSAGQDDPYAVSVALTLSDGTTLSTEVAVTVTDKPLVEVTVDTPTGGTILDASGTIACPGTCAAKFAPGADVSFTTKPDAGQKREAWTGLCAEKTAEQPDGPEQPDGSCSFKARAGSLGASFTLDPERDRTLTVTEPTGSGRRIVGEGIDCPGDCSQTYNPDTSVSLRAFPSGRVSSWSGCGSSKGSFCDLTVSNDVTVTVDYASCPLSSCVSFDVIPGSGVVAKNTVLSGGEFVGRGITVGADPEGSYCAGSGAGVLRPGSYDYEQAYPAAALTTMDPDDTNRCHGTLAEVRFSGAVRSVSLDFYGASSPYRLRAYDADGNMIASSVEQGNCCGPESTISVTTSDPIARITFGHTASVTAITELRYGP